MAAEGVVGTESTVILSIVKRADAFKHGSLKVGRPAACGGKQSLDC
jgi:hypothetical protein